MDIDRARVLVVGATGAIGSSLAGALHAEGARVVLAGRDQGRLASVAAEAGVDRQDTLAVDLRRAESCVHAVYAAAQRLDGLDLVVVATGVVAFGPARDEDPEVTAELFAVNTFGPQHVVRAALPHLTASRGTAVVLSAVVADHPTAGLAAYSASKAALSAWLDATRVESRRDGVRLLDVRPPHLDTGLERRPIAGTAARLPPPHPVGDLVARIVDALRSDARVLAWALPEGRYVTR